MANQTKYPKDVLETAKSMFLDNIPVTEISKEMSIPRATIQYYVKKYWRSERDMKNSRLLKDISRGRIEDLNIMQGTALKVLNRTLSALANRHKEPSTQEAMHVTKILETIHKIVTSEEARESKPIDINPEEALIEIQNDPFLGGHVEKVD